VFKSLGSFLNTPSTAKRHGGYILALYVRLAASESIKELFRDLLLGSLKDVKVSTFKNGVLTIRTASLLATELQMRSEGLKKEINRKLGKKVVEKIRFRIS